MDDGMKTPTATVNANHDNTTPLASSIMRGKVELQLNERSSGRGARGARVAPPTLTPTRSLQRSYEDGRAFCQMLLVKNGESWTEQNDSTADYVNDFTNAKLRLTLITEIPTVLHESTASFR